MKSVYLDYAAATPMSDEVMQAMRPYFSDRFHNPSAAYLAGRAARRDLNEIRSRVAVVLGCRPAEVIFTAGATEANNLAVQGVMDEFPGAEVLVSAIEHESVIAPAGRYGHKTIPVDERGLVILNKLSILITDRTVLISVMLVNNELGTIQPLREIAEMVNRVKADRQDRGIEQPLYLHTDAAQAANYLDLHSSRLGVDLMSLNGGKIYGPKQSGALFVRAGTRLRPLIAGGGQEFGLRSGTENLAAAAGFAKALETAAQNRQTESDRLTKLRQNFEKLLLQLPNSFVNGSAKHRAPHLTSLTVEGVDNERLMMELDERGVQCAVGSACSAGSDEPSPVLKAIGMSDKRIHSTLRFSLGKHTTAAELEKTAKSLSEIIDSNR